jgi:enoyl-CoA hydratase/carnithine racemase
MGNVLWASEAGVCTITMSNPDAKNAFDQTMIDALVEGFRQAGEDPDTRVVVLTGAGDAFCAGGNVKEMGAASNPLEGKRAVEEGPQLVQRAIRRLDKPTIAMINGAAFGAGFDMALACDMRVSATTARMCESYINLGLIAGDGGAYLLPRIAGLAKAMELLLTGRPIDGIEAAELGIVNYAFEPEALGVETYRLADSIAAKPPAAVRAMKRLVWDSQGTEFDAALNLAATHIGMLQCGPEHAEAVAAFREATSKRRSTDSPTS